MVVEVRRISVLQGKGSGYQYYGLSLSRSFLKEERLSLNIYCNNFWRNTELQQVILKEQNFMSREFEQISEPVLRFQC